MTLFRTALVAALLLAGCSKPGPGRSDSPPPPEPKRNLSESLGFQSGEDVFARNPSLSGTSAMPAGLVRTLTGRDGRTLEALLLSRTATSVKVRRTSDNAEFTIPFEKLSDSDCAFITKSGVPVTP